MFKWGTNERFGSYKFAVCDGTLRDVLHACIYTMVEERRELEIQYVVG